MPGNKVKFHSENSVGDCHAVIFGGSEKCGKALILLHAWWGLNEEIQEHASEIASQTGFIVLVPDLYRGRVTKDRETAGHYMADLDWYGAVKDVQACARFLHSQGGAKVGVTGFCMGGALCFLSAALVPEISAAAPFYGISKPHLADLTKIEIPVQGHFGEKDNVVGLSSPGDYKPLKKTLIAAGVDFELFVYKDAQHGFAHPSYPTYDLKAAQLAFSRVVKFMDKHLQ